MEAENQLGIEKTHLTGEPPMRKSRLRNLGPLELDNVKSNVDKMSMREMRTSLRACVAEIEYLRKLHERNWNLMMRYRKKIRELTENRLSLSKNWVSNIIVPKNAYIACRFCLTEKVELLEQVDWTDLGYIEVPRVYEEVTGIKLDIWSDCSEFCCIDCIKLLKRSATVIKKFRDVDEFWRKYLAANEKSVRQSPCDDDTFSADIKEEFFTAKDSIADDQDDEMEHYELLEIDDSQYGFADSIKSENDCDALTTMEGVPFDDTMQYGLSVSQFLIDDQSPVTVRVRCKPDEGMVQSLSSHQHNPHEGDFECDICKKTFYTSKAVEVHKRNNSKCSTADTVTTFICDICSKELTTLRNLKAHRKNHARAQSVTENTIFCEPCQKPFSNIHHLRYHNKTAHPAPPPHVACSICDKTFQNTIRLRSHMVRHSEKKFQCDVCKRKFLLKKDMKNHILLKHGTERLYVCELCGFTFKVSEQLSLHRRKGCVIKRKRTNAHKPYGEGIKFTCDLCPTRHYAALRTLGMHYSACHPTLNWDEVVGTYCQLCTEKCESASALDEHKAAVHGNLMCQICKRYLVCEATLRSHLKTHSNKERPYECNICGSAQVSMSRLKAHVRRHNIDRAYKCPECNRGFSENFELNVHIRTVHMKERRYFCQCGLKFNTKSAYALHETIHTKDFKWQCEVCDLKFFNSYQLREHLATAHPDIEGMI